MDYTVQNLGFKLKKVLRYVSLYGPQRTLIKVKGQFHMKKNFARLPDLPDKRSVGGSVGIIGCGNFAYSNIAYYLKKNFGDVIRGSMDIDPHKAASLYQSFGLRYFTDNAEEIISDPELSLVYIASNHATHAEYAIAALEQGKHVHIEKPHVVNKDQLIRLCQTMERSSGRVALGFNRTKCRMFQRLQESLNSQSGPLMLNWFVAGHEIAPEHWYFKEEEGGRVLGNLCHWTDFIYNLIPADRRYPITIQPTRGEKSDCDIAVTYLFGDGSIAAITFSAKGHTFEGVRERFAAHRGNVLIAMDDFKRLVIEDVERKKVIAPIFRDHGHECNIVNSYNMAANADEALSSSVQYVWETAELFLKTRAALETQQKVHVTSFDRNCLINEASA